MKKVLKGLFTVILLTSICVSFAGCGEKDSKSESEGKQDKIVATKHFEAGDYTETMEVYFEDGKASKFIITMEFDKESSAKSTKERFDNRSDMKNAKINIDGTKVSVEMDAEEFYKEEGLEYNDEKASKDGIKQLFKENDFSIIEE